MFKNVRLGRNHIIAGIFFLMLLVTGVSMIRISYNENIVESYEAATKILPERTKVGMMDAFWQKYTGGTRNKNITQLDATRAQSTINSAYSFMIGADVILGIGAAILIFQPIISQKLKK